MESKDRYHERGKSTAPNGTASNGRALSRTESNGSIVDPSLAQLTESPKKSKLETALETTEPQQVISEEENSHVGITKKLKPRSNVVQKDEGNIERIHVFKTVPAKIRVSSAFTKNLGDFQSARIEVSLEVPCYKEDVESTYQRALTWVGNKLQTEINLLDE